MSFMEIIKAIFDNLGAVVVVPVIMFIIAIALKVPAKKAFITGLSVGVGLEGFSLLTGSYGGLIAPIIDRMVTVSGINLPVFDMGWQACSVIAYSTEIGMMFVGVCIALQLLMFVTKFTNVFLASDLWNNYTYMVYGSFVYIATNNVLLAFGCMIVILFITLLCAEMIARRFSGYYGYDGCTVGSAHIAGIYPWAVLLSWILNLFGLYKVKADPVAIRKKLGFMGEPMTLGLLVGLVIGICGNFDQIFTLAGLGSVLLCGIATSAVMAVFPKVSAIFAGAFTSITSAAKKNAKSKDMIVTVNDATGYGETATLTTGLILMPLVLLASFILPGNKVLPVLNLTALPYLMIPFIAANNGNVVKSIISGLIYSCIALYMDTLTATMFTGVAMGAGIALAAGATMICCFNLASNPYMILIMYAFISKNPIFIALAVIIPVILFILFRKNKTRVLDWIDSVALKGSEIPANTTSVAN